MRKRATTTEGSRSNGNQLCFTTLYYVWQIELPV